MGHPDFARLKAYDDGELPDARRERVARHLAACAHCRAELTGIRALRDRAAAATILAVPEGAWEQVLARRAAGERMIPPAGIVQPTPSATPSAVPVPARARTLLRRAALLLLGVAGVASASVAVPRVRAWMGRDTGPARTTEAPKAEPAPPVDAPAPPSVAAMSGVSIMPSAGRARVDVDGASPALRIRVRLVAGDELEARATGAAAGATFHPRPGRLRVQNAGPGELELLLPRSAARVDVRVDGQPYLVKDGAQLRVLRPGADTAGSEVLLRVGDGAAHLPR